MKISSRNCGIKENEWIYVYLETKDKTDVDSAANNSKRIQHTKKIPQILELLL